jgi:hypothetical protein
MGTNPPQRPRDPNQLAKRIIEIATGEVEDTKTKAPNRAKGGKAGGIARSERLRRIAARKLPKRLRLCAGNPPTDSR